MEAEIREILTEAVREPDEIDLFRAILRRFDELGGVELDIPPRDELPRVIDFS